MARYRIRWNDFFGCYFVGESGYYTGKLIDAIRAKRRLIQMDKERKNNG